MNKLFLFLIAGILLASSLVFAQNVQDQIMERIKEGEEFQNSSIERIQERIRERVEFSPWQKRNESECPEGCKCVGAIVMCRTEDGKEMTIEAGRSGKTIKITVVENGNESEVETSLGISSEFDKVRNRTKLMTQLSNGRNAEVKIMHHVANERALERLRLKVCSSENNCTVELKEVPSRNENRLAYEVKAEKRARVLGLFKAKMNVETHVDAETGEVIFTKKPWWRFLSISS